MRVRDRALLGAGSLPEREWDHANRQQQKKIKCASKKMPFDAGINLFFHFDLGLLFSIPIRRTKLINVKNVQRGICRDVIWIGR